MQRSTAGSRSGAVVNGTGSRPTVVRTLPRSVARGVPGGAARHSGVARSCGIHDYRGADAPDGVTPRHWWAFPQLRQTEHQSKGLGAGCAVHPFQRPGRKHATVGSLAGLLVVSLIATVQPSSSPQSPTTGSPRDRLRPARWGTDRAIQHCSDTSTSTAPDTDPNDGDSDANDGGAFRQGNEPSVAIDPTTPTWCRLLERLLRHRPGRRLARAGLLQRPW